MASARTWESPLRLALGVQYPADGFTTGRVLRVSATEVTQTKAQLLEAKAWWDEDEFIGKVSDLLHATEIRQWPSVITSLGGRPLSLAHVDQSGTATAALGYALRYDKTRLMLILGHTSASLDLELEGEQRVNATHKLLQLICRLEPRLEALEWTRIDRMTRNVADFGQVITAAQLPTPTRTWPIRLLAKKEGLDAATTDADQMQAVQAALARATSQAMTTASTSQSARGNAHLQLIERNLDTLATIGETGVYIWPGPLWNRPYGWRPVPSDQFNQPYAKADKLGWLIERDEAERATVVDVLTEFARSGSEADAARKARSLRLRIRGSNHAGTDGQPVVGEDLHLQSYRNAVRGLLLGTAGDAFDQLVTGNYAYQLTFPADAPALERLYGPSATPSPNRPGYLTAMTDIPLPPLLGVGHGDLVVSVHGHLARERRGGSTGSVGFLTAHLGVRDADGVRLLAREQRGRVGIFRKSDDARRAHHQDRHRIVTLSSDAMTESLATVLHDLLVDLEATRDPVRDALAEQNHREAALVAGLREDNLQVLRAQRQVILTNKLLAEPGSEEQLLATKLLGEVDAQIGLVLTGGAVDQPSAERDLTVVLDDLIVLLAVLDDISGVRVSDDPTVVYELAHTDEHRKLPQAILREFSRLIPDGIRLADLEEDRVQFRADVHVRVEGNPPVRVPISWTVGYRSRSTERSRLADQIEVVLGGMPLARALATIGVSDPRRDRHSRISPAERTASWYRAAESHLRDLGLKSMPRRRALLDCPIRETATAVLALARGQVPVTPWHRHLAATYLPTARVKGAAWLEHDPRPERRVLEVLGAVPDDGGRVTARELAAQADLPPEYVVVMGLRGLVEVDRAHLVRAHDCPTCGSPLTGYCPCPELAISAGLFCVHCMTVPGLPDVVLPPDYGEPWVLVDADPARPDDRAGTVRGTGTQSSALTPPTTYRSKDLAREYGTTSGAILEAARAVPGGVVSGPKGALLITSAALPRVRRRLAQELLSAPRAADLAGVGVDFIHAMADNGTLASQRDSQGRRTIRRADLLAWSGGGLRDKANLSQAAERLGIGTTALCAAIDRGELTPFKLVVSPGGKTRTYVAHLELDRYARLINLPTLTQCARLARLSVDLMNKALAEGRIVPVAYVKGRPRFETEDILMWATSGNPGRLSDRLPLTELARVTGTPYGELLAKARSGDLNAFQLTDAGNWYAFID